MRRLYSPLFQPGSSQVKLLPSQGGIGAGKNHESCDIRDVESPAMRRYHDFFEGDRQYAPRCGLNVEISVKAIRGLIVVLAIVHSQGEVNCRQPGICNV